MKLCLLLTTIFGYLGVGVGLGITFMDKAYRALGIFLIVISALVAIVSNYYLVVNF